MAHAIELNLRKGGTTHPFLTLQFLTDGRYDGPSGPFLTSAGAEKHLVATTTSRARRCVRCASTTSSTPSPGTGCTSTSPARPAWCST